MGEIVAWKLREAFPDRQFPVEYMARPGLTLDKVHFWMTSLERRPDLVILYAGHNEFQMRYDWAHARPALCRRDAPGPRDARRASPADHSPLCRLIQQTVGDLSDDVPPTRNVEPPPGGRPRLHRGRVRRAAARLPHAARGDGRVLRAAGCPGGPGDPAGQRRRLRAQPIIPAPADHPGRERDAFAGEFRAARRAEDADPTAGIAAYRALLARQPGFAEAHYRLARLLEATGQREEADRHYVAARDCDGFPMRCTSDFQDAYRDVAARHPGAILVDGPAVLRGLSPRGVVGDDFFTDGFHPS